jgi:hypothetical protein
VQYYTEPLEKIVYYGSYRLQPLYEGQRWLRLSSPEAAATGPLASPTRQSRRL